MRRTIESLPEYLRRFCSEQHYDKYTARDHSAWRYIMRRSRAFFSKHAVPIYLKGLKETGIPIDRIPRVTEMDDALRRFGWGAVPVCGFIPPAAFLEFQTRKVLAIATDMRTIDHIGYTPAPDIVHEAAGHAPIVADDEYRDYLTRYAQMAAKAIISDEDLNVYEAIRVLSDMKENPDMSSADISRAQAQLDKASKAISHISESTKVARMAWWTVEYGLLGSLENPKIYGAGLLSSVGESQHCLSNRVKKIPLTIRCIEQTYDITEPQPQLFVAEDIKQLVHVLEEFDATLSYRIGGTYGLETAKKAKTVNTVQLENGLEMAGVLTEFLAQGRDVSFVKFIGPTQICHHGKEISGQDKNYHAHGFSSPIGRWKKSSDRSPASFTQNDLESFGIKRGNVCNLEFVSGFRVEGKVKDLTFQEGKVAIITWTDATVTRGSEVFFQPDWGNFDMVVGEKITSVYGGPADKIAYGDYKMGAASTTPGRTSPFTAEEKKLFEQYGSLRSIRENLQRGTTSKDDVTKLNQLAQESLQNANGEWLLKLELLELSHQMKLPTFNWSDELSDQLKDQMKDGSKKELIEKGLDLASERD